MRLDSTPAGNKNSSMEEERTTTVADYIMPPPSFARPLCSPPTDEMITGGQADLGTVAGVPVTELTIEAAMNSVWDVLMEEAATPIKAPNLGSEDVRCKNQPVTYDVLNGKCEVKEDVAMRKAGPESGGDSVEYPGSEDETTTSGGLARLGKGKRPRNDKTKTLRAGQDEPVDGAGVVSVNP